MNNHNGLIAKFLGYRLMNRKDTSSYWQKKLNYGTMEYLGEEGDLKYDSDWNWLMKAVDRVEQLSRWWSTDTIPWSYNTNEIRYQVFVQPLSGGIISEKKIDAYYEAVITFIKYYNDIQMED